MTLAPRSRDDCAAATEAVLVYQAALHADEDHRGMCPDCAPCPDGEDLGWKRRRAHRQAKAAVRARGYQNITAYLEGALGLAAPWPMRAGVCG